MTVVIKKVTWMGLESPIHYTRDIVIKYASTNKVLKFLPPHSNLANYISRMIINGSGSYPLVDIKIRRHREGDNVCLAGFHYDCVKEYDSVAPHENHLIWTNTEGTEFFDGSKAGDGEVWCYGRDLHRGPVVTKDCDRIVTRLSSSDIIKPKQFNMDDLLEIHDCLQGNLNGLR